MIPKRLLPLLAGLMLSPLALADEPEPLKGCAAKEARVREEMAAAPAGSAQQAGLQEALENIQRNCNDSSLHKERENKVLDAKREVSQRQADLDKAIKKGDPEKIDKRKNKLADARKQLQEAVDELDQ
ncbi:MULTISPECIES: DUF1090 domain-containing protein [unclassified Pseudomonas]|uniref:DUF1090 domain-containing protein n=1 Tax=unclassified Pseudomonas TaxID=196821 RepID=UPI000BDA6C20|nr:MULTISPECIES: DUF1090 domain-containing protein [unclassified Pseudomonas]PVZ15571.1 uncharacterized protein DUF1090 [Pseudomonas sp. URIL14HWK12:I12]PVZ24945.1 uncharacterized protein DUF1090 [Pseudomonas sp. URIL14HWK12:I10]PVZ34791.1 uncharacterized protein DUF1090 [Pseudomonas sp. URIL14HWK12:I11]SNZ09310.1 Protein of unknown function [Pseudomonas sp. URIL14HWK12:I9]